MRRKVKNIFGENLDVLVEGNRKSNNIVIFVHGYGTDKNEGFSSFLDLSNFLQDDYLIIRFDQSGCGRSEGNDSEFQFQKAAGDVDSIIRFVRKNFKGKKINIIAHSLGTFIVSLLSPYDINKIIFTSIPNSNINFVIRQLQKRILKRGGVIDEQGITIYPRSSGAIQKMGPDFWRTLRNFDPIEYLTELAGKTNLIIFKPKQDEILADKYFDEYKRIPNLKYEEINGDHNFKNPEDRRNLFKRISNFLEE